VNIQSATSPAIGLVTANPPPNEKPLAATFDTALLSLTGVVRANVGGREVVLSGAQPRIILAYLALRAGHPATAAELAEVLWPRVRSPHWEGAVRGVIAKVRIFLHELGPCAPTLDNVGHIYRFVCDDRISIDVWQAEHDLAQAVSYMAAERSSDAAAAASRAAAALADTLLPGHDGEWLDRWRSKLDAMRCRALRLASCANTDCGNHDEAIQLARTAVSLDLYDESSHRALMSAHLAASNRAAGLRAYAYCRQVLADDLGVSPSVETEALYLRLLGPEPNRMAQRSQSTMVLPWRAHHNGLDK
jgi:DNA-binding SARP family transcriptional activator